jgi:hypothetical protein
VPLERLICGAAGSRLTRSTSERARNGGDLSAAVVGASIRLTTTAHAVEGVLAPIRLGAVPVDEIAAGLLRAGDVVRLDDPQAHRVERVVLVDGRVVVKLRPVGLDVSRFGSCRAASG